jgi:hypothetical protein
VPAVASVVFIVLAVAAIISLCIYRSRRGRWSRGPCLLSEGVACIPVSGDVACTPCIRNSHSECLTRGVLESVGFLLGVPGGSLAVRQIFTAISRRHAVLRRRGNDLRLEDLSVSSVVFHQPKVFICTACQGGAK